MPVVDTDRLEKNNIPYKIKDNKVYIPEDAFDKVIVHKLFKNQMES